MNREEDTIRFPLSWTEDPLEIIGFDFDYITITKREMVYFLDEFETMRPRKMIELY